MGHRRTEEGQTFIIGPRIIKLEGRSKDPMQMMECVMRSRSSLCSFNPKLCSTWRYAACIEYLNSSISQQIRYTMSSDNVQFVVSHNAHIIVWMVRLIIPVQSLQLYCNIIRSSGSIYNVRSVFPVVSLLEVCFQFYIHT